MALVPGATVDPALAARKASLAGTLVQPPGITPPVTPKPAVTPTVAPTAQPGTLPRPAQPPTPNVSLPVPPPVPPPMPPPPAQPPPGQPNIGPTAPPDAAGGQPPIDFLTGFGPEDDLRFQQINPVDNARLTGLQSGVDTAAGKLSSGPDLGKVAQDRLALLEEQSNPAFQRALQDVGRRAAAQGSLGAGMTTSNLNDVLSERERYLSEARKGLASDTAFAQGGENRANLASLGGLESQLYGQGANGRNELRTERAYEADTAQQALQNRIQQKALEDSLLNSAFGRQTTAAELGLEGAQQYGQQAGQSGQTAADLLQELAYQEALKKRKPSAVAV